MGFFPCVPTGPALVRPRNPLDPSNLTAASKPAATRGEHGDAATRLTLIDAGSVEVAVSHQRAERVLVRRGSPAATAAVERVRMTARAVRLVRTVESVIVPFEKRVECEAQSALTTRARPAFLAA